LLPLPSLFPFSLPLPLSSSFPSFFLSFLSSSFLPPLTIFPITITICHHSNVWRYSVCTADSVVK
jgi:hypothetical protein